MHRASGGGEFEDEEGEVITMGGQLSTQGFLDNFEHFGFYSKLGFSDML